MQINELIKYLDKSSTIVVMVVLSTFLSFEKKFNEHLAFFNIINQRDLCVQVSSEVTNGVRKKFPRGPKFLHNRVRSQIKLESGEGTTIIGWSRGMPGKILQNYTQRYAVWYILEASFSIMLLRDLLEK